MAYRLRGVGDVFDMAPGTKLDCGLFAGGIFQAPCQCVVMGPWLCDKVYGEGTWAAVQGLANPDVMYAPIQQPPAPPAVDQALSTLPAPYSSTEYADAVNASLGQQIRNWQGQNQGTMDQTAANIKAANDAAQKPPGVNWLLVGGIAAAAVFGFALIGDRR